MIRRKDVAVFLATFLLIPCSIFSLPDTAADRKVYFSGSASLTEGQFVAGHHKQKAFEYRPWIQLAIAQIRLDAFVGRRLHVTVAPEVKLWYNNYPITDIPDRSSHPFRQYSTVAIADGQGILAIGNPDQPFMHFSAGVIHYKYNHDARNLGEYLFRTGVHPPYIFTEFDYAFARVYGLRLGSELFDKRLSLDWFLSFEPEIHPVLDGSISLLAGYEIPSLIDVGAGVQFNRCLPVSDEKVTTPSNSARNAYFTSSGEMKYYSFGGTKLMARVSFDPKGVLPERIRRIFGAEDGKIYAEMSVLGVKNYPKYMRVVSGTDTSYALDTVANYYNDIMERIPLMIGFNIPCFKVLDVFSMEWEWYGWPNTNSYYDQGFGYENPIPKPAQSYPASAYKKDNWKFSIYAKRQLFGGFSIIGQLARDHTHAYIYAEAQRDEEEVFTLTDRIEKPRHLAEPLKWGEFGWWLKLRYNF
ncbi:MAG: hypothetical protein JW913_10525 [Chitinispirillaceae bacterium]|nr:hypothetical protein [Chitinispirillaceae bacterium]